MKRYLLIFIGILFVLSAPLLSAETIPTTGFIPGPIWYSKASIVAGDNVKIHTVVWNGGDKELSVRVEFYDKNILLGTRDVVVPKAELKDVSISWQVKAGDHSIYARIVSGEVTVNETPKNKLSIPVAIKEVDGVQASSADVIKNEVNKVSNELSGILPESVSSNVSTNFNSIDVFRNSTAQIIKDEKDKTQKKLDIIESEIKIDTNKNTKDAKILDATNKPIAYIKLFFLFILGFILGNKIVFYGLSVLIIFFILRFLYRKIRNR